MKVFISYSQTDKALAHRVADVLRRDGLDVWMSDEQVFAGDNWAESHSRALREADAMVVLITPAALNNSNVLLDASYALGQENYRGRLIPVIAGPPEKVIAEMPWSLRNLRAIQLGDTGDLQLADHDFHQIAAALKQAA